MTAWRRAHRARAADIDRRAHRKWAPKRADQEARWRERTASEMETALQLGASIITEATMRRPRYTYLDQHGTLHAEFWESAEQMIVRMETASTLPAEGRKKGSHRKGEPA
jgi:hypothetical protein